MMNYVSHWDYFDTGTDWPEWRGVRTQRHTYAKWLDGKEELYDNIDDPYQMKNLVESPEAPARRSRSFARAWTSCWPTPTTSSCRAPPMPTGTTTNATW